MMITVPSHKEKEEETRELYLKTMIFLLVTISRTINKEISDRFKREIEIEFGKDAWPKIIAMKFFQDYSVLKPLLFLNGLPYRLPQDHAMKALLTDVKGGIDLNSANLNMLIKRNGKGVVLPVASQDLAQLSNAIGDGLEPHILSIVPASQSPVFAELVAH